MTRDEAIKIWKATFTGHEDSWGAGELQDTVEADVDAFVALGMLKLDEPKRNPETVLCEILSYEGVGGLAQRAVLDKLISAGLRIVEK